MSQAQGVNGRMGYQIESSLGVVGSPDLKSLYFLNESLKESINLITSQVLRDNRNPTKPVRGNRDVAGGFKTELAPSLGTLFRAALGSVVTSGAGPYTHVITVGDLPSLTFEKGFSDLSQWLLFPGCKVNKMTLAVKPEGFQDIDFDLMGLAEHQVQNYDGQTGSFAAGLTVTGGTSGATGVIVQDINDDPTGMLILNKVRGTFQDGEALTDTGTGAAVADGTLGAVSIDPAWTDPGHSPFDGLAAVSIEEGGSSIAYVTGIDSLTIENNLDGGNYVVGGGGIRRSLPDGKVRVSGTVTALFEDRTLYDKALKYQESSLKLIYQHGTGAGTAGNEYLEIFVPELYYAKETPVIEGPTGVIYRGPFEAFYDNGADASALKITLKNTEATI